MKKSKYLSLLLTLSVILSGCGKSSSNYVPQGQNSSTVEKSTVSSTKVQDLSENEKKLLDTKIIISESDSEKFAESIFRIEDYSFLDAPGLPAVMEIYNGKFKELKPVYDKTELKLLVNLPLNADEYYEIVKKNNENNSDTLGFIPADDDTIKWCCQIICDTINKELTENEYGDKIYDIDQSLNQLSIGITRSSTVSNASYNEDGTMSVNITNTRAMNSLFNAEDADLVTITHETEHLIQSACVESKKKLNLTQKYGFMPMFEDMEYHPMFWDWFIEASAEKLSGRLHSGFTYTYRTKIGYLDALSFITVLEGHSPYDLPRLTQNDDINSLFDIFDCRSDEEKEEIIRMMHAIDIIQQGPTSKPYFEHIDLHESNLQEFTDHIVKIKIPVLKTATRKFYTNLAMSTNNKKMSLDDIMYLMFMWECNMNCHSSYTDPERKEKFKELLDYYLETQDGFFSIISANTGIEINTLEDLYEKYCSSWKIPLYKILPGNVWEGKDISAFDDSQNLFIKMLMYNRDINEFHTVREITG